MIGKLIILIAIVVALVVFVPHANKMIGTPALDAVKQRIDYATAGMGHNSTTTSNVSNIANQQSANGTTPISIYQLDPKYVNKQRYAGQVFQKTGTAYEISVPGMAETINGQKELTHIIETGQCPCNVGEPVQVTLLTAKPDAPQPVSNAIHIVPYADPNPNDSTPNTRNSDTSTPASSYTTLPPYYQVISLHAQNEGNKVLVTYYDSTGKTISVTVTLRNSDKQIFSGTFKSSEFQAEVKDIPDTPHMIDMTIENSDYGTLHGSVYAPSNIQNSTINGIFGGP